MSTMIVSVEGLEDVVQLMEDLKFVGDKRHREIKREIRKAAKPMKEAVKAYIKDGNKSNGSRTLYRGVSKKTGKTKTLDVSYRPGNLRRSIDIFTGKKGLYIHVGARFGRKAKANADGFYSAMVHYGVFGPKGKSYKYNYKKRPNVGYVDRAYLAGLSSTEAALRIAVNKIIDKYIIRL